MDGWKIKHAGSDEIKANLSQTVMIMNIQAHEHRTWQIVGRHCDFTRIFVILKKDMNRHQTNMKDARTEAWLRHN
jgi:hypothetical protein